MTPEQREAILDNARYLHAVRPVDPDEIHEYVPAQPHPAAVRQVLREHAFELKIRERKDGTFVPVGSGPAVVEFDGVEAFPAEHAQRFEDRLVETYGPGWPKGESGDRLRERITELKAAYHQRAHVEYTEETALAYGIYHLADFYAAVQYVLADLASDHLLPRRARVLDVGAGVGGPALGMHDLYPADSLVEYHAVEPSEAGDVFEHMVSATRPNFQPHLHRITAESFNPESNGPYDLLLFANVLSELDDPVSIVERFGEHLRPEGSIVALAPADRNTATTLRQVERALAERPTSGYTVYAPTVRLWPGHSPTDGGWSFDVRPDVCVPRFQRKLAEAARDSPGTSDEYVNVDVQYAYAVLRTDGKRAIEYVPDPDRVAKMAEMDQHVTERIDLVGIKLSHDLADTGNPVFKIGDGSEAVDHYAVLARESSLNRDIRTAGYGDLLFFENVLVLWNEDEEAYNLVVDGESIVDQLTT